MKNDIKPILVGGLGDSIYGKQYSLGNRVYDSRAISMAHCANPVGNAGGYTYCYLVEVDNKVGNKKYRIRKLTENECYKLMGFTDEDCQRCKDVGMSKTQLYKQAGNSIVTNCIELLFEHLYKSQYNPEYITFDENFIQAVME